MTDRSIPSAQPSEADRNRPWWRYPIVWLVVGGPAAVVVASLYTVGIAVKHVDPVLDTSAQPAASLKTAPAAQARDHALDSAPASQRPAEQ